MIYKVLNIVPLTGVFSTRLALILPTLPDGCSFPHLSLKADNSSLNLISFCKYSLPLTSEQKRIDFSLCCSLHSETRATANFPILPQISSSSLLPITSFRTDSYKMFIFPYLSPISSPSLLPITSFRNDSYKMFIFPYLSPISSPSLLSISSFRTDSYTESGSSGRLYMCLYFTRLSSTKYIFYQGPQGKTKTFRNCIL